MKKYSILMYNFNHYEIMREPEEIDPECEYIYITDDDKLKSNKWKIIVDHTLDKLSVFDKCYSVRFNLFKYVTTNVCIYMDASIQIHKSLRKIYDDFIKSECDVGLNIHPDRNCVADEYPVWVRLRNYSVLQMNKAFEMFKVAEWNPKEKGLYQGTMRICKNTELNKQIDNFTFQTLKKLGTDEKIERLDQTVYSFIINKFFKDIKIFPFSQQVFQSNYLTWCYHGTRIKIDDKRYMPYKNKGYILNKLVNLYGV